MRAEMQHLDRGERNRLGFSQRASWELSGAAADSALGGRATQHVPGLLAAKVWGVEGTGVRRTAFPVMPN
jgi:hypothetical protein